MRPSGHHRMIAAILIFALGGTVVDRQPLQGAPSKGLTLSISTTQSAYKVGESIGLLVTIRNVSEAPITTHRSGEYSEYQFLVRYDGGPYLSASKHPRIGFSGSTPPNTWLDGGSAYHTAFYAFDSLFDFTKPGTYTVTAVTRMTTQSREYYTTLTSNVLTIRVH